MKNTSINVVVGCCGIVCSECESFTSGICKGCRGNEASAYNCHIMECCMNRQLTICAECSVFIDYGKCDMLSDVKNLNIIREIGLEEFIKKHIK